MKNDLPYFSHDNDERNKPEMRALRARYNWEGVGRFWALNEMVSAADGARLDLSRKVIFSSVACELGLSGEEFSAYLSFLADPEECGLIHFVDGVVTTDRTQEDYSRVETERLSARARKERKLPGSPELPKSSPENVESSGEQSHSSAEPEENNTQGGSVTPQEEPGESDKPVQESSKISSSGEQSQSSPENIESSGELYKRAEQSRKEEKREEQLAASSSSHIDNEEVKKLLTTLKLVFDDSEIIGMVYFIKQNELAYREYMKYIFQDVKNKKPTMNFERYFKKVFFSLDAVSRFKNTAAGERKRSPPPTTCPECRSPTVYGNGRAKCTKCGLFWLYSEEKDAWEQVDRETGLAV